MDGIECQNHITDFTGRNNAYLKNFTNVSSNDIDVVQIKDEFRLTGNKQFNAGDFKGAIESYSNGLAIISPVSDGSTDADSDISLLANRSAAYLSIGHYSASLADANTVLSRIPFHKKAIFRKSKSLFGLARYEEAVEFLQELTQKATSRNDTSEVSKLLDKAKMYYQQHKFGEYNTSELIKENYCRRLDLAEFVGPIDIVNNLNDGKGRGLIATENISAGQLLMACKAFDIVFPEVGNENVEVRSSFCGKYLNSSGEMKLVYSIQKLLAKTEDHDMEKTNEFYKLYAGPDLGHLNEDERKSVLVDFKRIEGICTFNGFAHGETVQSSSDGLFENWGLWILPSYINHSCVDCNSTWKVYGDFMFVRAFKSIHKGEEILISYLPPEESYQKRKSILNKHQFVCNCRLCNFEISQSDLELGRRHILLKNIENQVKLSFPNMNVNILREMIKKLEKDGTDTQLNFYLAICYRKLAEWHYGNFEYYESAKTLERAYKIVDGTVVCRTAVHVAVNIISSYLKAGNWRKAQEWVNTLKENVRIAYGTPVKEIILKVAPHTAQEIQSHGMEF